MLKAYFLTYSAIGTFGQLGPVGNWDIWAIGNLGQLGLLGNWEIRNFRQLGQNNKNHTITVIKDVTSDIN